MRDTYILRTNYGKKVVKDDVFGVTIRFIPATVYDNKVLMENDPLYVKRLENLPENEKKAFLYGDWDIFEGRFFGEWKEKTHVIKPFNIPRSWKKAVSIDWGYNDYCDVLWHAMDGEHVYTYRELHVKGRSVREVARDIKILTDYNEKIDYYVGSPDMWQTRGTGETLGTQNIASIFAEEKLFFQKANDSRIVGWQVMREYMQKAKDKTPKWLIFNTCKNLIRCLPLAQYDDNKLEDMATEPHEITDALDSARYFFMTRPVSNKNSYYNVIENYTPRRT